MIATIAEKKKNFSDRSEVQFRVIAELFFDRSDHMQTALNLSQ